MRRHWWLNDLFYFLVGGSWVRLLAVIVAFYLVTNSLFAFGYWLDRGGVEGAEPGSYLDAFFFSVQTLATIGYGRLAPVSLISQALVTVEALAGLLGVAVATGLIFTKFSRPTSRVIFSDAIVIAPREGKQTLIFRMANERGNQIVDAQLRVVLIRDERTREGESVRRVLDLPLFRSQNPAFSLSWMAMHVIDERSPLHGETHDTMAVGRTEILVSLVGIDGTFSQTVHARHAYSWNDVHFDMRFADTFVMQDSGERVMDMSRFQVILPAPASTASGPGVEPAEHPAGAAARASDSGRLAGLTDRGDPKPKNGDN